MKILRVGVYGGSLNPPHIGHAMLAASLSHHPEINKVIIPVCYQQTGKDLLSFEHRFAMSQLAFGWIPNVEVTDIERELGGESLSLRTMQELKRRNPSWALRFVAGADVIRSMPTWDRADELMAIAPPLPFGRVGVEPAGPGYPPAFLPQVSSSDVRKLLEAGDLEEAARHLPRPVFEYILEKRLYQQAPPTLRAVG